MERLKSLNCILNMNLFFLRSNTFGKLFFKLKLCIIVVSGSAIVIVECDSSPDFVVFITQSI